MSDIDINFDYYIISNVLFDVVIFFPSERTFYYMIRFVFSLILALFLFNASAHACDCSKQLPVMKPGHFKLMFRGCDQPKSALVSEAFRSKFQKPSSDLCFFLGVEPTDKKPGAVSITVVRYFQKSRSAYRSNVLLFRGPGFFKRGREMGRYRCDNAKCVDFDRYESYHNNRELGSTELGKWHAHIRRRSHPTNHESLLSSHAYQADRAGLSGHKVRRSYLIHYRENIQSAWLPFEVGLGSSARQRRSEISGLLAVDLEIEFLGNVPKAGPRSYLLRFTGGR